MAASRTVSDSSFIRSSLIYWAALDTLHMASIIIFGTLWRFAFREWKDASSQVRATVWSGIGLLVLATVIIGYGNSLAA